MDTQTATSQAAITPAKALERLKEGNKRFVKNWPLRRNLQQQMRQTSDGQYPFAVVLGCIDSRVPPEFVFDQGIGDVFSVRVAGHVLNADSLGSIEFGCAVAGAKLIVVLGHTKCGAIMGACDDVRLGNLTTLLSSIKPAVEAVDVPEGEARSSQNAAFVQKVAEVHVARTLDAIKRQSPVLNGMLAEGTIALVGAMYDVETGIVSFFD